MSLRTSVRVSALELLSAKGYHYENAASGSGVPAFSRVRLTKDGESLLCAVKTTQGGRISFPRDDAGEYKSLNDFDRVLHVWHGRDENAPVRVSFFDQKTLVDAFDRNLASLKAEGIETYQQWLSTEKESGPRFVGSGYGEQALWVEELPNAHSSEVASTAQDDPVSISSGAPLTIAEAKRRLAETFSVQESDISITISA